MTDVILFLHYLELVVKLAEGRQILSDARTVHFTAIHHLFHVSHPAHSIIYALPADEELLLLCLAETLFLFHSLQYTMICKSLQMFPFCGTPC